MRPSASRAGASAGTVSDQPFLFLRAVAKLDIAQCGQARCVRCGAAYREEEVPTNEDVQQLDGLHLGKLDGEDDETVTMALIKQMSKELAPRILLEDFPQTEF